MKEKLEELKEDIVNERRHIQETIERLAKIRPPSPVQDDIVEPAMGTLPYEFL